MGKTQDLTGSESGQVLEWISHETGNKIRADRRSHQSCAHRGVGVLCRMYPGCSRHRGIAPFRLAAFFAGLVLLECLVLAVNRCRCPLTDLAVRYAPEDSPNFDIYLPRLAGQI